MPETLRFRCPRSLNSGLTKIPNQPSFLDARRPLGIPNPVLLIDHEPPLLVSFRELFEPTFVVEDGLSLFSVEVVAVLDGAFVGFEPGGSGQVEGEMESKGVTRVSYDVMIDPWKGVILHTRLTMGQEQRRQCLKQ